jgi:hypothetical protein
MATGLTRGLRRRQQALRPTHCLKRLVATWLQRGIRFGQHLGGGTSGRRGGGAEDW